MLQFLLKFKTIILKISRCWFIYIIKNTRKFLNLLSFQTTVLFETCFSFQFVSLFGQIVTEKLKNLFFKIIWLHCLYKLRLDDKQTVGLNKDRKMKANVDKDRCYQKDFLKADFQGTKITHHIIFSLCNIMNIVIKIILC